MISLTMAGTPPPGTATPRQAGQVDQVHGHGSVGDLLGSIDVQHGGVTAHLLDLSHDKQQRTCVGWQSQRRQRLVDQPGHGCTGHTRPGSEAGVADTQRRQVRGSHRAARTSKLLKRGEDPVRLEAREPGEGNGPDLPRKLPGFPSRSRPGSTRTSARAAHQDSQAHSSVPGLEGRSSCQSGLTPARLSYDSARLGTA